MAGGGGGVAARAAAFRMLGQQGHAGEGLGAVGAGIFLDVGVGLKMSAQIGSVGEGSMAVLAAEGLLASMGADVALQQPGSREGFAADVAFAGQSVSSDVHFESAQGYVGFLAVLAAEGLFHLIAFGGRAVELLVFG